MASALGGEPTPPGTLRGAEVKRNVQRRSAAHAVARSSSQNNSPIAIPKPGISRKWRKLPGVMSSGARLHGQVVRGDRGDVIVPKPTGDFFGWVQPRLR